jgi:splicing suppressor protein 51
MLNGSSASTTTRACSRCKKPEPSNAAPDQKLKRCSRCRSSLYCSRACQRADWKTGGHKRHCMFGAMVNNCYLDGLPSEEEAMDQLIDAYRLRVQDDLMYRGHFHGRYADVADDEDEDEHNSREQTTLQDFRQFLDLAEAQIGKEQSDDNCTKKPSILPSWWSPEKRAICERRAMGNGWSVLRYTVEKVDIQEHYNDSIMPMKLRMLAETVYGSNVMGR